MRQVTRPRRWRICSHKDCRLHYYGSLATCERCRTRDYRVRRELRLLAEERAKDGHARATA